LLLGRRADQLGSWPGGGGVSLIGGGGGGVSLIGRKEGDSGFISPEGAATGRSSGGRSEGRHVTEEEGELLFLLLDSLSCKTRKFMYRRLSIVQ
jgi:hypothetical protein